LGRGHHRPAAGETPATPSARGKAHFDQCLRLLHGQRPQAHGIEQLEDGGVGADTKRQRENCRDGKPLVSIEQASGEPDVLPHGVE